MAQITASQVNELRRLTDAPMMACKKALTESDGDMEKAKEILRLQGAASASKKAGRDTTEGAFQVASNKDKLSLVKIACETDFVARNDVFKDFLKDLAQKALTADSATFIESMQGTINDLIGKLGENIKIASSLVWDIASNSVPGSYVHFNGKIGVLVELESSVNNEAIQTLAKDIAMHIAANDVKAVSSDDLDPAEVEKEKEFLMKQARDSGKPEAIIEKMIVGRLQKYKKEICLVDQSFVKDPSITIEELIAKVAKEQNAQIKVLRFHKDQL